MSGGRGRDGTPLITKAGALESGSAEFTSSWQPDLEDFKPPPQDNFGGHLLPALFQDCDVNAQRNERATPQPGLSYLLCPPVVKFSKQSWGRGPIAHNSKEMTMPFYSSMLLSNQPPPFVSHPLFGLFPTLLTWGGRWWPRGEFHLLRVFSSHCPLPPTRPLDTHKSLLESCPG